MKVVIIGAGTGAMNVADILVQDRNLKLSGFIGTTEEGKKLLGKKLYRNVPFIGDHRILKKLKKDNIVGFVAAIKNNSHRERAYYDATQAGLTPINVISRHAVIEPSVNIGKGVVVCTGCIISHGVSIGNNTIFESGVIIEIYTVIGENCFFSTASVIGGKCDIRRNTTFGLRSVSLPRLKIGKNQTIEDGRLVVKSLPGLIREKFEE